jgi:hypothetical protein
MCRSDLVLGRAEQFLLKAGQGQFVGSSPLAGDASAMVTAAGRSVSWNRLVSFDERHRCQCTGTVNV